MITQVPTAPTKVVHQGALEEMERDSGNIYIKGNKGSDILTNPDRIEMRFVTNGLEAHTKSQASSGLKNGPSGVDRVGKDPQISLTVAPVAPKGSRPIKPTHVSPCKPKT